MKNFDKCYVTFCFNNRGDRSNFFDICKDYFNESIYTGMFSDKEGNEIMFIGPKNLIEIKIDELAKEGQKITWL